MTYSDESLPYAKVSRICLRMFDSNVNCHQRIVASICPKYEQDKMCRYRHDDDKKYKKKNCPEWNWSEDAIEQIHIAKIRIQLTNVISFFWINHQRRQKWDMNSYGSFSKKCNNQICDMIKFGGTKKRKQKKFGSDVISPDRLVTLFGYQINDWSLTRFFETTFDVDNVIMIIECCLYVISLYDRPP